ncbi:MAG TPA: PEP/pyruvate-binding domain-containing protein [Polyangia bacterium]|jgi:phosphohistidine swiveling domain-containing protein|nr:PEP/pyruvate-binding domain-containing protein [Polyangia bacterium]
MTWCLALSSDDPTATPAGAVGGKARSLLRLAEAGLAVPPAFVVTDTLYRHLRAAGPPLPVALRTGVDLDALERACAALLAAPWPPGFSEEIVQHLARLAPADDHARFSVRSSFAREDDALALGAGVYESMVGVERDQVPAAIRRVLASALAPGAVAYAQAHGETPDGQAPAVLIHRMIDGRAAGSAALDPTGGAPAAIEVTTGALGAGARAEIERALCDLAARHGAIEVEWVESAARLVFLQLRRYLASPPARGWAAAGALAGADWRWDAAHNPLPLSPAQAGLVELVDRSCRIGLRQRVAGGYLFYASGGPEPPETIDPGAIATALAALAADLDRRLATLGAEPALEEALALFVEVYQRLYGVIQPAARRATRALEDFLRAHAGELGDQVPDTAALLAGVPSIAQERQRLAEGIAIAAPGAARDAALAGYLDRFGDEAPIWDVAVPTYREDPTRLQSLVGVPARTAAAPPSARTQDQIAARLSGPARQAFAALVDGARRARAVGEDDDWVYARAQAAVRRALLASGAQLCRRDLLAAADDIFWLALERVRALAASPAPEDGAGLRNQVAAARAAHDRAVRDPPAAEHPAGAAARGHYPGDPNGPVIQGQRASAGRVIGRAFVHRSALPSAGATASGAAPTPASIVVATTLLPTELPLLPAAGLVMESGGALGHVAAQARERGIPALVGARGATTTIADGDLLLLDADAGCVVRLG